MRGGKQVRGTQVGGIQWFGKSTPSTPAGPTAAEQNIINYLKGNPETIISHPALKSYLDKVNNFSKEISKPSEKERNETISSIEDTAKGVVAGTGGSRLNRKRPTTRKYSKSSSSVKKGKTYKIRI
jgi:hypothetical protein